MRDPNPRQDQKTCVVGHQAKVAPARRCAPADVAVAAAQMARRRTPGQACEWSALCPDHILQMLAHWLLIAEIMMMLDEAVKQRLVRRSPHLLDRDGPDF